MSAVLSDTVIGGLDDELIELAARTARDPVAFTMMAWPWGEKGTPLENVPGPDAWQMEALKLVGEGLSSPSRRVQLAVVSGNGCGKSALSAILTMFLMTTCADTRVITTSNTQAQLIGKSYTELRKWWSMCLFKDWFEMTATALYSVDPDRQRSWRAEAIPSNENKPESFQGLHVQTRAAFIFDEASAIGDSIFDAAQGSLTDAGADQVFILLGNGTRTSGKFHAAFHGDRHRWKTMHVDSRTCRGTDKTEIRAWIDDYGIDSDFVKTRVTGHFPSVEAAQFIGRDLIDGARSREPDGGRLFDPLVIGCDIARQGGDMTVLAIRKGRDARTYPWIKIRSGDLMQVAAKIADLARQYRADGVFVDGGGIGAGVVDRLRQLRVPGVMEVQFGGKSDRIDFNANPIRAANKRAEIWSAMREWLSVGAIPDDPELHADLAGPMFSHNARDELLLERKEDMRRRGLASPDAADALALCFSYEIAPSALSGGPYGSQSRIITEYEPEYFGETK